MGKFDPTDEQSEMIEGAVGGEDLVVQAGAGSGKSSTVRAACTAMANSKRIFYLVFNKAAQLDAQRSFPGNVECRTVHSLAYRAVGRQYGGRPYKKVLVKRDVDLLGLGDVRFTIKDPVIPEGNSAFFISGYQITSLARRTIDRFCGTADTEITASHVPLYRDWNRWFVMRMITALGSDAFALLNPSRKGELRGRYWKEFSKYQNQVAQEVLPVARHLWERTQVFSSDHYFTPDMYLKIWSLTDPKISADAIFVDEAQDSTFLVRDLVLKQDAQKVAVGDTFQQMYKWRGAEDILQGWPGRELRLTQSFRFGQSVAEQANRWIKMAGGDLVLRGNPAINSRAGVGIPGVPTAVLCRSNAMCIAHTFKMLEEGRKVGVVGGVKQLTSLVRGALGLWSGKRSDHPDLVDFVSWEELLVYAKSLDGREYKVLVKLVEKYGQNLISTLNRVVDEKNADVVVSTMHKAKGLEFRHVLISAPMELEEGEEIPTPSERPTVEESMINYVAVTRAQEALDYHGISWIDHFGTQVA